MNPNPLTALPPNVRLAIYVIVGCLVLVANAAVGFYGAVPSIPTPEWLYGAQAALNVLSVPALALAAGNVHKSDVNGV